MFKKMTDEERKQAKLKGEADFKIVEDSFLSKAKLGITTFYKNVPQRYKRKWLNAHLGKSSAKKAIAAQCSMCVGYADVQNEVAMCSAFTCPLHAYRPYKN